MTVVVFVSPRHSVTGMGGHRFSVGFVCHLSIWTPTRSRPDFCCRTHKASEIRELMRLYQLARIISAELPDGSSRLTGDSSVVS
jgi:hypothetical protein